MKRNQARLRWKISNHHLVFIGDLGNLTLRVWMLSFVRWMWFGATIHYTCETWFCNRRFVQRWTTSRGSSSAWLCLAQNKPCGIAKSWRIHGRAHLYLHVFFQWETWMNICFRSDSYPEDQGMVESKWSFRFQAPVCYIVFFVIHVISMLWNSSILVDLQNWDQIPSITSLRGVGILWTLHAIFIEKFAVF